MELYIHIPFCMKKCDYCDFLSASYDRDMRIAYTEALCREIEFFGKKYKRQKIETIFIGGGTPSWLEVELMEKIMLTVKKSFKIHEEAEISMEVNPGTTARDALVSYKSWGLNRLSIGLQSANDDELKILGRIHTYERFLKTFEYARKCGFYNINIDIMTGIPHQTFEKLEYTMKRVISLKPEHVSAYALQIEEGTPFAEKYSDDVRRLKAGVDKTRFLPNEDTAWKLGKLAQMMLEEKGLKRYEISNYALPGMECIHNTGYWVRRPYLGVGIGAASFLDHTRYSNERDIFAYIKHCDNLGDDASIDSPMWDTVIPLSKKDERAEFMYLGLRMTRGISREEFKQNFGQDIEVYYGKQLSDLMRQDLIEMDSGRIALTDRGMDVSNIVLANFI